MRGWQRQTISGPASSGGVFSNTCSRCVSMASEDECLYCRECDLVEATLLELRTMSEDDGKICLAALPDFQLHIEPAVLSTFFWMPRINWKKNDKLRVPSDSLSHT